MKQVEIAAELRAASGKGVAGQMRLSGLVPCVVYGKGIDTLSLTIGEKDARELLSSSSSGGLIALNVKKDTGADRWPVLIKEVQRHPVKNNVVHIDFHKIALDEEITVEVPIIIVGEDNREQDEGIVQLLLRDLEVQCLPTDIPERIEVNVSELKIGDTVRVEDLSVDEGITVVTSGDEAVVSVVLPTIELEEDEAEEGEGTDVEPELVGEEDEDEE